MAGQDHRCCARDLDHGVERRGEMVMRRLDRDVMDRVAEMIDEAVDAEKQIHVICDNYATHKHPKVQGWLARHKRFHVHFTPTSASWLNLIERFFRDITENRIRRGVFLDLEQLILAIGDYIDRHNESPKPVIWTAKANDILEKVTRAQTTLNKRLSA